MRRGAVVFLGGGLGSICRAVLLEALTRQGALLPVLLINLVGAFLLGILYVLADDVGLMRPETRLFLAVGVLGGFTTFGTFGWGADVTLASGSILLAVGYVVASVAGGVIAVGLGIGAGRVLVDGLERAAAAILLRLHHGGRRPRSVASDMGLIETESREESA